MPPHVPNRRDGEGRIACEVDDIMLLLTFWDEQQVLDKLPGYVSDNPDRRQSNTRLYEGNLQMLTTLLLDMNGKLLLNNLQSALQTTSHTTIKITSEFRNVGDAARDAYAMSHLSAEACTQRLAAGRGDGYQVTGISLQQQQLLNGRAPSVRV